MRLLRRTLIYILLVPIFIDFWLMIAATKISHRLQRATGLTCYFVARVGLAISVLSLVYCAVIVVFMTFPFWGTFFKLSTVLFFGIICGQQWKRSHELIKAEERLYNSSQPTLSQFVRTPGPARVFWAIGTVFGVAFDVYFGLVDKTAPYLFQQCGFYIGMTIFSYFGSVVPLPPGKSKLRKWIDSMYGAKMQEVRVTR
jgi:hypothetical protein